MKFTCDLQRDNTSIPHEGYNYIHSDHNTRTDIATHAGAVADIVIIAEVIAVAGGVCGDTFLHDSLVSPYTVD